MTEKSSSPSATLGELLDMLGSTVLDMHDDNGTAKSRERASSEYDQRRAEIEKRFTTAGIELKYPTGDDVGYVTLPSGERWAVAGKVARYVDSIKASATSEIAPTGLMKELEDLRYAADCPVSGTPEDNMALWAKLEEAYRAGRLVEAIPSHEGHKTPSDGHGRPSGPQSDAGNVTGTSAPSTTACSGETPITNAAGLWLMAEGPLPADWKCPPGQEADIRQFDHQLLGPRTEWKVVTAAVARRLERKLAEAMNRCDEALEAAEAAVRQRDTALPAIRQSREEAYPPSCVRPAARGSHGERLVPRRPEYEGEGRRVPAHRQSR